MDKIEISQFKRNSKKLINFFIKSFGNNKNKFEVKDIVETNLILNLSFNLMVENYNLFMFYFPEVKPPLSGPVEFLNIYVYTYFLILYLYLNDDNNSNNSIKKRLERARRGIKVTSKFKKEIIIDELELLNLLNKYIKGGYKTSESFKKELDYYYIDVKIFQNVVDTYNGLKGKLLWYLR